MVIDLHALSHCGKVGVQSGLIDAGVHESPSNSAKCDNHLLPTCSNSDAILLLSSLCIDSAIILVSIINGGILI